MKISGFNKLTLVDFPQKMAAIVFTAHCNMMCPYCHNSDLVLRANEAEEIPHEYILEFLEKRKNFLDGLVISGGEPLIHKDIETFIQKVRDIGYLIKLDTNGTFPDRLEYLVNKGLIDYVAMDIKNDLENYGTTIGVKNFNTANIERSIKFLLSGKVDYEFRTTTVSSLHYEKNFENISSLIKGCSRYYLQAFVANENTICKNLSSPTEEEMLNYLKILTDRGINAFYRKG